MLTNTDITIYNKYIDPVTKLDAYHMTQIKDVMWNANKGVNVIQSGITTADAVTLIIYMNGSDFGTKTYKSPKAWKNTPNVDMSKYFTLANGDIIVKGLVSYDINVGKLAGLEKTYDEVYKITSVDTQDKGSMNLQHWRVGAG